MTSPRKSRLERELDSRMSALKKQAEEFIRGNTFEKLMRREEAQKLLPADQKAYAIDSFGITWLMEHRQRKEFLKSFGGIPQSTYKDQETGILYYLDARYTSIKITGKYISRLAVRPVFPTIDPHTAKAGHGSGPGVLSPWSTENKEFKTEYNHPHEGTLIGPISFYSKMGVEVCIVKKMIIIYCLYDNTEEERKRVREYRGRYNDSRVKGSTLKEHEYDPGKGFVLEARIVDQELTLKGMDKDA